MKRTMWILAPLAVAALALVGTGGPEDEHRGPEIDSRPDPQIAAPSRAPGSGPESVSIRIPDPALGDSLRCPSAGPFLEGASPGVEPASDDLETRLAAATGENSRYVRLRAVYDLINRHLEDARVVALLLELAGAPEDPDFQLLAVLGLAASGDPRAAAPILALAIGAEDARLASEAVQSLAALPPEDANPALLQALSSAPHDEVRRHAASLLGMLASDDPATIRAIGAAALGDPASSVRGAAIDALAGSSLEEASAILSRLARGASDSGESLRAAEHLARARALAEADDAGRLRILSEETPPALGPIATITD